MVVVSLAHPLTHDNTSTATVNEGGSTDATAHVLIVQNPDLSVTKTALPGHVNSDGKIDSPTTIAYTITVHNAGNMSLTNVVVSDSLLGPLTGHIDTGAGVHGDNVLNVGETWTFTPAPYSVTQGIIDNGGVVNSALAVNNTVTVSSHETGQTTAGHADDAASVSVPILQNPDLSVSKIADVNDVHQAGDVIPYRITVTNTGNMTLTLVAPTDPLVTNLILSSGDTNGDGKLDLTESWVYTGSYTLKQSDIDNGGVVDPGLMIDNTVTVTSHEIDQVTTGHADDSDSAGVAIVQNPHLALVKSGAFADDGNHDGVADLGEHINYTFTVTNTGNMTLHNVAVTDPGTTVSGSAITLAPGAVDTATFTATHTITQADLMAGTYHNTATVDSDESGPASGSADVPVPGGTPHFTLVVSALGYHDNNNNNTADTGDVIDFKVLVTNDGTRTLTNIAISDLDGVISFAGNPIASLLAGVADDTTVTGTHNIITASDTSLSDTAVGQSDQFGNPTSVVSLVNYAGLSPL